MVRYITVQEFKDELEIVGLEGLDTVYVGWFD